MKNKHFLCILLTLAALLSLAATASADAIFTAMGEGYNTDRFGLVTGKNAPTKNVVVNLQASAGANIASYVTKEGQSRILIDKQTYNGDVWWVYNPYDTDWSKPLKEVDAAATTVTFMRGAAAIGNYLYAIGNKDSTVARFNIENDAFTKDKTVAEHGSDASYNGEGLFTYNGKVYVFIAHNWKETELIEYDSDLKKLRRMDVKSKNPNNYSGTALSLHNNKIYMCAWGDLDGGGYSADSKIEEIDLDTMTSKILIGNDTFKGGGLDANFAGLLITPANDVYIALYTSNWQQGNSTYIYKTTLAALEKGDIGKQIKAFTNFMAWCNPHMTYDIKDACLYVAAAETGSYSSSLYRFDGTKWDGYDDSYIGGNISLVKAILPPKAAPITSSGDVQISTDKGEVSISGDLVISSDSREVNELANRPDYSVIVNGVTSADVVYPGQSVTINLSHKGNDEAAVTFTISSFTSSPAAGGTFKALIKKNGSDKYEMIDTIYDKETKTLKFTIAPVGDYFSENTIVIAEVAKKQQNASGTGSEGDSAGGCSSGFGAIALLALIPLAWRRKR